MKILINNEEVVCDKNITIEEKILSTSSTILKNCYPKSWEITKDYTNNYYYPVDYSKCKIYDDGFFSKDNLDYYGKLIKEHTLFFLVFNSKDNDLSIKKPNSNYLDSIKLSIINFKYKVNLGLPCRISIIYYTESIVLLCLQSLD